MLDDEAAARAKRQVFVGASGLGRPVRGLVELNRGTNRRVADGQPADLGGRRHVTVHQRRRDREDVCVVVEPDPAVVGGEQRGVDVQRQQVVDGVDVLEAIETVHRNPARIGRSRRRLVQRGFERRDELIGAGLVGTRPSGRRHLAGADLADHFLEILGVHARLCQVDLVEHQPGGLQLLVVARHAILVEQGPIGRRLVRGDERRPCDRRRRTCGRGR